MNAQQLQLFGCPGILFSSADAKLAKLSLNRDK
jgi:hypothetical protein